MSLVDVLQNSQEVSAFQLDGDREGTKDRDTALLEKYNSLALKEKCVYLVCALIIFCMSVVFVRFCYGAVNEIN